MKKIFILLSFISLTLIGFSQSNNVNPIDDELKLLTKNSVNQGLVSAVKNGVILINYNKTEKIKTTFNGVIVTEEPYKPQYPTPMFEQKKPITGITNQTSNN